MGKVIFDYFTALGSSRVRVRVSGLLVQNNSLLLIAHKKRGEVYWLLPGGGVKYGESLLEALEREFCEELGIDIDVQNLMFVCDSIDPRGGKHILNVTFRCTSRHGDYRLGREKRLYDYGFFNAQDISEKTLYPPVNRTLMAILNNEESELYLGSLWLL